ncbi:MAG: PEP-CTERM sorting domain-containing protein [Desmonostoc vinosum HA7617-LM4]|jgi:hypothetical protein|nr:PEP-CTERM sorting domain-containing protein [Desmonostoc vinosum HA7617-LM4]
MKRAIQLGVAISVSAIASLVISLKAEAAKVNLEGNNATGIEDLQVGDKLYDVSFINDAALKLFDPKSSTFPGGGSFEALQAINNTLNSVTTATLAGGQNYYILSAGLLGGDATEVSIEAYTSSYDDSSGWIPDYRAELGIATPLTFTGSDSGNFAILTLSGNTPPVPEPASILGSMTAAGLLIAMKKKVRRC